MYSHVTMNEAHGGQCVKAESATNLVGGTQDSQAPTTERFWA